MLKAAGTVLVEGETAVGRDGRLEYVKLGKCGIENSGVCIKHETKPELCRDFRVGSRDCLRFRAEYPQEVQVLTDRDVIFQNEYFGWEE